MKKILLIDDDAPIREFLSDLFKSIGHQVLIATNGEDGLDIFKQNADIDIVLTDDAMPEDGDGLELVEKIRHIGFPKKIIMMSGSIDETMALAAGANQFLAKPIPLQKILSAVQ